MPVQLKSHFKRTWRRWVGGTLTLLLVAVAAAPSIIVRTSLKDRIVERSAARRHATARIETVRWGWLSVGKRLPNNFHG